MSPMSVSTILTLTRLERSASGIEVPLRSFKSVELTDPTNRASKAVPSSSSSAKSSFKILKLTVIDVPVGGFGGSISMEILLGRTPSLGRVTGLGFCVLIASATAFLNAFCSSFPNVTLLLKVSST